jgi:hypothetical protein
LRAQPVARTLQNFGGRLVAIDEFERPMLSDEVETAQTIALMDAIAAEDAPHRFVITAVDRALETAGLTLDSSPFEKACAIYWFLKRTIRMVPTPGTNPLVDQTLIPPASLLAMEPPEGDCPQFSMLGTAMLSVCCVPSFFKTIAADPDEPNTYSHVYLVVDVGRQQLLPFDASHGPEPGAEYNRRFKEKIWPAIARDRCKENAMLRNQPIPQFRNHVLRRSMAMGDLKPFSHLYMTLNGLGDDGDDGGLDLYSEAGVNPNYTVTMQQSSGSGALVPPGDTGGLMIGPNLTPTQLATLQAPGSTAILSPSVATGSSGLSLAASLAADATQLAAPVVRAATAQAPYYTTNPATGATQLYNPSTGQFVGTSISAMLASISPTTLMIGGGLLLVLLMSGKR